jgi:streptomycin 6-kinase
LSGDLRRLAAECAEAWSLELDAPFAGPHASYAAPAVLPDGTEAVLKVGTPHRESEREADALALWGGDGAVRLLAQDAGRGALLLERCWPGTPLSHLPLDDALDVFVELLPRLWVPAGPPFRPLADEAAWWASSLAASWAEGGQPFERRLLDAALAALGVLPGSQGEQVLLHQDLHGNNVLSAEREPWLAIDPKPLAGEREFAVAPIVRSRELGHSARAVTHRLDRLTSELGLDRERARLWSLAQTVAWSFDEGVLPGHVETARWLLDA